MRQYAVEFLNVSYQYSDHAQPAIHNINLKIPKGEFLLISGASGSGKTSLARCINGLIPNFHEGNLCGTVLVMGKDTKKINISQIGEMVGSVFQDPKTQFFMTDTTNEVAFGCANMGLSREQIWSRTEKGFQKVGIQDLKDRSIFELSSGEMQKVAVASCCAMEPEIYVFDEPSANLDMHTIIELSKIMEGLKNEGKTVIVLEHRLFYLAHLFDRMLFFENGTISREYSNNEANCLSNAKLMQMGLRNFQLKLLKPEKQQQNSGSEEGTTLELIDISFTYSKGRKSHDSNELLEKVNFNAKGGEIIGIVGENGAGKTTLSRLCCGLLKETSGTIKVNGNVMSNKRRLGTIYFVMQDSDYQLFSDSVWNELTIGKRKKEIDYEKNQSVLEKFLLWDFRESHPASLSRGQKQRITIASALVDDSNIIFFDEPTSGLDRWNMNCVAKQLGELAEEGRLIFVVTHDYEFLLAACNRVLHLANGKIQNDFPLSNDTKEKLADILLEGGL